MQGVFDYIICGAGTSGCAIAGRLAEAQAGSILLLEAGAGKEEVPFSAIPAGITRVLGSSADWNIRGEPTAELDGRSLYLSRGKFVGGSSGTNAALCIKGTRQDFDDWDIKGWDGETVFRYMAKAEAFTDKPWFDATIAAHGTAGPIKTAPHEPAPISWKVLESFQSKGLPLLPDLFSDGTAAAGCGHAVRTIHQGIRSTSADYLTKQPCLTILTSAYVDRVLMEDDRDILHAHSVVYQDVNGVRQTVRARKEIILSSGTFGSPTILMRSGIGAGPDLKAHEIAIKLELPGVGSNLQDHMLLHTYYEVLGEDITLDKIWHTGGRDAAMAQYSQDKTGFLSQMPFGCFAWTRLDDRLQDSELWQDAVREAPDGRDPLGMTKDQPHAEFWNTECYCQSQSSNDFPSDGKYVFSMAIAMFGAKSRGTVKLRSTNPTDLPVVDHKHLSDPIDMLLFSEACVMANEIVVEGAGTKAIVCGSWPEHLAHHKNANRTDWEQHIRKNASTCYHPAGTCRMGKPEDTMSVVDDQLRVKGVRGLRVADASIIPLLPGGHPQMACYAIGEKLADLLLGRSC